MEFPVRPRLVTGIIFVLVLSACGGGTSGASGGGSGGSGGITFDPATESCSNPVAFTQTITLPSLLNAGTPVFFKIDGILASNGTVSATGAVQQPDGSWKSIDQSTAAQLQQLCTQAAASPAGNSMALGTHTEQALDANNKVLAEGSYTVTK